MYKRCHCAIIIGDLLCLGPHVVVNTNQLIVYHLTVVSQTVIISYPAVSMLAIQYDTQHYALPCSIN